MPAQVRSPYPTYFQFNGGSEPKDYSWSFTVDTEAPTEFPPEDPNTISFAWGGGDPMMTGYAISEYHFDVDWGDGTIEKYDGSNSAGDPFQPALVFSHTYANSGRYQIKLTPTELEDGVPVDGWLAGFRDPEASMGGMPMGMYSFGKIVSIDTPFPEHGFVVGDGMKNKKYANIMTQYLFSGWNNLESAPENLFENVAFTSFSDTLTRRTRGLFNSAFSSCASNTTFDVGPLAKTLFDKFGLWTREHSEFITYQEAFSSTFSNMFSRPGSGDQGVLTISDNMFSAIRIPDGANISSMFSQTFESSPIKSIPPSAFALAPCAPSEMSSLFNGTFSRTGISSVPEGLLDFLGEFGTSGITDFSSMFGSMFSDCSSLTSIPERLFAFDTSNGTNFGYMFSTLFNGCSSLTSIPERLFALDTSNGADFSGMFSFSFATMGALTTVPEDLFSFLDTAQATSMIRMLEGLFSGDTSLASLPEKLFASITIPKGQNIAINGFFSQTFQQTPALTTVPEKLFSSMDTHETTSMYRLFASAFINKGGEFTVPAKLFSGMDTSSCSNFEYMFSSTFSSCPNLIIPEGLFSEMDTSQGLSFSNMFSNTFQGSTIPNVPSGLLNIDVSNGVSFRSMFNSTFRNAAIGNMPSVLFFNLALTISADNQNMLNSTFSNISGLDGGDIELSDVFSNTTGSTWISRSTAASILISTFSATSTPHLTGRANTVLSHFRFTPDSDTNMFRNQTKLSDYRTINTNWK